MFHMSQICKTYFHYGVTYFVTSFQLYGNSKQIKCLSKTCCYGATARRKSNKSYSKNFASTIMHFLLIQVKLGIRGISLPCHGFITLRRF